MSDELLRGGLKLRHLQIFREVLRAGSTRRAAANLGISQPAVSQQVKQLEVCLGLALFDRTSNRITPLREAWALLRRVDEALRTLDQLDGSADELARQEIAPVSIAAPSVFGFAALPAMVRHLRERTAACLRSISGSDSQVKEHILTGRADLGIARLPIDPGLFDWSPLATGSNVCIFNRGHRFSGLAHITATDLIGEAIIDIAAEHASHQMNIDALRFRGFEPAVVVEFDDTGHEVGFVSAGLGIAITNEVIAREYAAFPLEIRPFTPSALYHYVAIWKKDRKLSEAAEAGLDALKSAFGNQPG